MAIKRVTFKKYAGMMIRGTTPLTPEMLGDLDMRHILRAFWLTAQVESGGVFGTVMNYDGSGMTAGVHQAIMVYPKELAHEDFNAEDDQGSLGQLLRKFELVRSLPQYQALSNKLARVRWYIAQDGLIRFLDSGEFQMNGRRIRYQVGDVVHGKLIRDEFSGLDGFCAVRGAEYERVKDWVQTFHELFSASATFDIQVQYALSHIVHAANTWKLRNVRRGSTIQEAAYGDDPVNDVAVSNLGEEMDLAMAFFWSNSVNAPGKARQVFETAARESTDGPNFARRLIRLLGNTSFARWDDDLPGGRYQRTRNAAMKIWDSCFFSGPGAIMPKDLPG